PNKMLIDATHPEETRVVVLRGNRVEEFDFESASRKQLRGNIYLAKVTRVEPSLQAAFVDYGGNRHGFLAFSEIHPDYYQIPVADRQALIDEEERAQRAADDEADRRSHRHRRHRGERPARRRDEAQHSETVEGQPHDNGSDQAASAPNDFEPHDLEGAPSPDADDSSTSEASSMTGSPEYSAGHLSDMPVPAAHEASADEGEAGPDHDVSDEEGPETADAAAHGDGDHADEAHHDSENAGATAENGGAPSAETHDRESGEDDETAEEVVESVGGADALEEVPDRAPRYRRQYKIQEVIKRRQVMLVQVVKEERGTKGAALTTYLSLAGRYSVLMPNTARGGGISRKITNSEDRARLKEAAADLEVP